LGAYKTTTGACLSVSTKMMDGMMQPTALSNPYCKKTIFHKEEDLELIK
jgi:hypothetical protein